MAMLLTYLKTTAENAISTKVADCVISVSRMKFYCNTKGIIIKVHFILYFTICIIYLLENKMYFLGTKPYHQAHVYC
jgi:hypothetical protein